VPSLTLDVAGPVQDTLDSVVHVLPRLVAFLLILLLGWVVATVLRRVVTRLLRRVGFDRAVERGGVGRALSRARYDASELLARLVFYAVVLFTLQLAFGVWGPNPVSDLIQGVVAWLPRAFVAIIIVVVASAIAAGVRALLAGALDGLPYGRLLATLAGAFIVGLGVIAALNQVGVATSVTMPVLIAALATVAGILIVGVGGGMVRPMQQRWESWLGRVEEELPTVRRRLADAAAERQRLRAEQRARAEAEQRARAEAEQRARAEAEQRARAEAEQRARAEAEQRARAEAERRNAAGSAATAGPGERRGVPASTDEPTQLIPAGAPPRMMGPQDAVSTQLIPPQPAPGAGPVPAPAEPSQDAVSTQVIRPVPTQVPPAPPTQPPATQPPATRPAADATTEQRAAVDGAPERVPPELVPSDQMDDGTLPG
jgi:mechanosensitive ion channel-like protein